jgi:asparagine synthetase B (glutamine-hydrolysing)
MRDVLTHRGPDDAGIFVDARDGRVALGHRRLSIVDVAAGQQPMTNEDGSLHITYNGEIYNHAGFRESLETRGHVYNTHCDTETILHLYEGAWRELRRTSARECLRLPFGISANVNSSSPAIAWE